MRCYANTEIRFYMFATDKNDKVTDLAIYLRFPPPPGCMDECQSQRLFVCFWYIYLLSINRLIFQIPQCIRQMSHNALFCNKNKCSHMHVHIFHGYKIVHFGIWDWYIMGFVNKVNLDCTGAQGGAWFRIKRRQAAFHWQCQDSNLGVSVSRTHSDSPTHWMPVIIIKRLSYPGSN